jgi:hypothetical protein
MIPAGAAALLLLAFTGDEERRRPAPQPPGFINVRHQQIIIRVQGGVRPIAPAGGSLIQWREGRGPRCVSAGRVIGAARLAQNGFDLVLRDNSRIRARLERRCPALDYYRGFYINATEDGRICADRDSIRSRAGGECQIEQFHSLHPTRP